MHFEVFSYGHDWEELLAFVRWWIMSEGFSRDIKEGEQVDMGVSVRDIEHTIKVSQQGEFCLLIEKGAIISDSPKKLLQDGEIYINKGLPGETGFDHAIKEVEQWLSEMWNCDPYQIDSEKATFEGMRFDTVGVGLCLSNHEDSDWKISITANAVGIPK
jgi:hypothetical protein